MIKPYIIFDKNKLSKKINKYLKKKLQIYSIKNSTIIIVIGGDGFMLSTLKKFYKFNKPFYGVNSGNYGFLMNKFSNNIIKDLSRAKTVRIFPLEMKVKTRAKIIKKSLAINEISILRQSKQTANISIFKNKKPLIKKLVSDGVIVSTPAGSTAYNLSVYGPILSLDSRKLSISPISPFRPRRWKGKVVNDNSMILIKNLNPTKRPLSSVADNNEVRNAESVAVKVNKKVYFDLMFNKNRSLQKKINIEQLRKEIN